MNSICSVFKNKLSTIKKSISAERGVSRIFRRWWDHKCIPLSIHLTKIIFCAKLGDVSVRLRLTNSYLDYLFTIYNVKYATNWRAISEECALSAKFYSNYHPTYSYADFEYYFCIVRFFSKIDTVRCKKF